MKYLFIMILISSCGEITSKKPFKANALQMQYINSLVLESKVYFLDCLDEIDYNCHGCRDFNYCMNELKDFTVKGAKLKLSSGSTETSIGRIAIGTAVGRTASKLILGN
jgi:hypothetical protein